METNFIEQSHEIVSLPDGIFDTIAFAARTCYRSEANATPENDESLVRRLIRLGHEAMIEHGGQITVKFVTDRATANEIVRHRLFSFAQESQRYVNYDNKGFLFVLPTGINGKVDTIMRAACKAAAHDYQELVSRGTKPEIARAILPNAMATTIVVSGNPREWRHCLKLRTDSHAHPQIQALMKPLLAELQERVPVVFDDIKTEE